MKTIETFHFLRQIVAQQFYNPDTESNVDLIDEYPGARPEDANLPILDQNDIEQMLEDSFDETERPEEPQVEEPKIPVTDEEFPEFATTDEAASWAQQNNEVIRINYVTKKGRDIVRNIEPHGQFMAQTTGNRILVTFDRTVGDIRAFIVDNIMHYMFTGKDFDKKFIVKG
jgi:predicted DNA-binding transcriptional regulator YafY